MSDTPTPPNERLEALGGMVDDLASDNPSPGQRAEQAQAETAEAVAEQGAKEWAMIPFMIGGAVCMIAPDLQPLYTEERCLMWGRHAHQVATKHGLGTPANMPEFGLAAITLPMVFYTWLGVSQKVREMKEGKATGLLAKVGIWWRARKAARAGAAADSVMRHEKDGGGEDGRE